MTNQRTSVSPLDRLGDLIAQLDRRISALERLGHVHSEGVEPPLPPAALDGGSAATPGTGTVDGGSPTVDDGLLDYDGANP